MAQSSYPLRCDDDVRDEFKRLVDEEDVTAGEMFARVVNTYKIQKSRTLLEGTQEIKELDYHVQRINEIYTELVKKKKDKELELGQQLEGLGGELSDIKAQLLDAQKASDIVQEQHQSALLEKDKELALLRENAIKEVQSANERADRAESDRNQWDELLKMAQRSAREAEARAKTMTEQVARAEELEQQAADADRRAKELEVQLQTTIQRMQIEKENEVLAARREAMNEQNEMQLEFQRLVKEKSNLLDSIRQVEKERDTANLAVAESERKVERILVEQKQLLQRVKDLEEKLNKKK